MRRLLVAVILSFGFAVAAAPAAAQSGHSHNHSHDDHDHDHKKKPKAAAARKAAPPAETAEAHKHDHGIETESLFGFVSGSDIGERGEKHLTLFFETHFGKRSGTFRARQPKAEFGYNPTDWLHVAFEVWGDHFKSRMFRNSKTRTAGARARRSSSRCSSRSTGRDRPSASRSCLRPTTAIRNIIQARPRRTGRWR